MRQNLRSVSFLCFPLPPHSSLPCSHFYFPHTSIFLCHLSILLLFPSLFFLLWPTQLQPLLHSSPSFTFCPNLSFSTHNYFLLCYSFHQFFSFLQTLLFPCSFIFLSSTRSLQFVILIPISTFPQLLLFPYLPFSPILSLSLSHSFSPFPLFRSFSHFFVR